MKGISPLISTVLIVLISVAAISMVLLIGGPTINRARESAIIGEADQNMRTLNNFITHRYFLVLNTATYHVLEIGNTPRPAAQLLILSDDRAAVIIGQNGVLINRNVERNYRMVTIEL